MNDKIKYALVFTTIILTWWLLFGGGELNSPSYGLKFLLEMGK